MSQHPPILPLAGEAAKWDNVDLKTHSLTGWPHQGICPGCGGPAVMLFATHKIAAYECRPNWPKDASPNDGSHPSDFQVERPS